jgi:hypothetical protein
MASRVSTFFALNPKRQAKLLAAPHVLWREQGSPGYAGESYFCFTAIAEISIRALLTKAAAWMVARAGLGSGITPL